MPIRNFWSLECGEVITAEELLKNIKGCEVYFPLHDVGVDLLVVKGKKHVTIQVKESRYFTSKLTKGTRGHSWHGIHERKFLRDQKKVDFYVFVTYLPKFGEHRMQRFENRFIIVPAPELAKRVEKKKIGKKGIYFFNFNFEGKKVTEKRNEPTDYSEYLYRWDSIEHKTKP